MQDDIYSLLSFALVWAAVIIITVDSFKVWHRQYIVTDQTVWNDPVLQRIYVHQSVLVAIVFLATSLPTILTGLGLLTSDIAFLISLFISLLCMDVSQQFAYRIRRLIHPVPYLVE